MCRFKRNRDIPPVQPQQEYVSLNSEGFAIKSPILYNDGLISVDEDGFISVDEGTSFWIDDEMVIYSNDQIENYFPPPPVESQPLLSSTRLDFLFCLLLFLF